MPGQPHACGKLGFNMAKMTVTAVFQLLRPATAPLSAHPYFFRVARARRRWSHVSSEHVTHECPALSAPTHSHTFCEMRHYVYFFSQHPKCFKDTKQWLPKGQRTHKTLSEDQDIRSKEKRATLQSGQHSHHFIYGVLPWHCLGNPL